MDVTRTVDVGLGLLSGLFAGQALCTSLVGVPAILGSQDPLVTWKLYFKNAHRFSLISRAFSVLLAGVGFNSNRTWVYVLYMALAISVVPYTLIFMRATNTDLFSLSLSHDRGTATTYLIKKWARLHLVRTALSIAAFLAVLIYL